MTAAVHLSRALTGTDLSISVLTRLRCLHEIGYPFSSYGEVAACWIQDVILIFLVLHYRYPVHIPAFLRVPKEALSPCGVLHSELTKHHDMPRSRAQFWCSLANPLWLRSMFILRMLGNCRRQINFISALWILIFAAFTIIVAGNFCGSQVLYGKQSSSQVNLQLSVASLCWLHVWRWSASSVTCCPCVFNLVFCSLAGFHNRNDCSWSPGPSDCDEP